jgi:nucleoside-diphosphate kinase
MQRTLFIVKPDAVERNLIGRILAHVEAAGFRVVEARMQTLGRELAGEFYAEHREKPFFPDLLGYMTSGRVLLVCLEREEAVAKLREAVGATDPAQAAPGTVRKEFGVSKQMNSVHASDSPASAERELKLFFSN